MSQRKFTLFWRTGKRDVIEATEDDNIVSAFIKAGFAQDTVVYLAFYRGGDNDNYTFNPVSKQWDHKNIHPKLHQEVT